jgi:hypothetical protein
MENSKWWLDSTTIRGAILAAFAVIKQILDLACFLKWGCVAISDAEVNLIVNAALALVSAAGVVMVIVGRIKAVLPLRLGKNQ